MLGLLAVLLPAGGGLFAARSARGAIAERVEQGLHAAATAVAQQQRQVLGVAVDTAKAGSRRPGLAQNIVSGDRARQLGELENVYASGLFRTVAIVDTQNRTLTAHPQKLSVQAAASSKEVVAFGGRAGRDSIVIVRAPIQAPNGDVVARFVAEISIVGVSPGVPALRFGQTGYVSVVARDGSVLVTGDRSREGRRLSERELLALGRQGLPGKARYESREGSSELAAYEPVAGWPWGVFATQSQSEALADADNLARGFLASTLLLVVAVVAIAFVVRRTLVGSEQNLAFAHRQLELLARIDPVTGIYNRRHTEDHLNRELAAARRRREPVSVLMIDIDHFKRVNDEHGHRAGDRAVRAVALVASSNLRLEDLLGRWGGEEFVAVLPSTSRETARQIAERLRGAVAAQPIPIRRGADMRLTVSIGCATAIDDEADVLVQRADGAMYEAKERGRDCVVVDDPSARRAAFSED